MRPLPRAALAAALLSCTAIRPVSAQPQCAIQDGPSPTAQAVSPGPALPPDVTVRPAPVDPQEDLPRVSPQTLQSAPVLRNVAAHGAALYDLGETHGMRTVFAVHGSAFQVFYVTPDGKAAIRGILQDANGTNVTRAQVAKIPGAIPSATIGQTKDMAPEAALAKAEKSNFGLIGPDNAPRLWVFVDPRCMYSRQVMVDLLQRANAGRVQVAVIPVGILDHEDNGASTQDAMRMLAMPSDKMVTAWLTNGLGDVTGAAASALSRNMDIAMEIHLRGTPTLLWQKGDGSIGRADGVPSDLNGLIQSARR